ncbi:MAG TPA: biotin/lipoyl-binding protein, partial [Gemmata sp.]|nr:biotin/lipoyl-binding protein [Gemmata sp.]
MLKRLRPAMYLVGVALVGAMLLGARALTGNGHAADNQKTANPPAKPQPNTGGLIVLGTVDSSPSPVAYGLPPVLQSGTIAKVYVKDGQEVKKGDPTKGIPADKLYEFDASIQKRDLDLAKTAVEQARNELAKAREAKKQHEKNVVKMEKVVESARTKVTTAGQLYHLIEQNLKESYTAQGVEKALWPQKLANNPDLFKANAEYADAVAARDRFEAELDMLKAANVDLVVKQAEIGIKQAEEQQAKAQTA